jgi:hypothetical protein
MCAFLYVHQLGCHWHLCGCWSTPDPLAQRCVTPGTGTVDAGQVVGQQLYAVLQQHGQTFVCAASALVSKCID